MKVLAADFVTSAAAGGSRDGIPRDGLPQVALAGRSNVGKSTLINALCRRTIARTSAAPGKTRLANVYRITLQTGGARPLTFYLVDLPGYGYARGGAAAAEELRGVAEAYFRDSVLGGGSRLALLLVDSRHPGLDSDRDAAAWLSATGVQLRLVATKIDKLSRSERARNLRALELTTGMPPLAVSAADGEGLDELWKTIVTLARTGHATTGSREGAAAAPPPLKEASAATARSGPTGATARSGPTEATARSGPTAANASGPASRPPHRPERRKRAGAAPRTSSSSARSRT